MIPATKVLSILLVWHGNTIVGTAMLDPKDCISLAKQITMEGFPAVCIPKACIASMAETLPGWSVTCPARKPEPKVTP